MNSDEQIREQERERIIKLIEMERYHHDDGVSCALGMLVGAIRGENKQYEEWLVEQNPRKRRIADLLTSPSSGDNDCETHPTMSAGGGGRTHTGGTGRQSIR